MLALLFFALYQPAPQNRTHNLTNETTPAKSSKLTEHEETTTDDEAIKRPQVLDGRFVEHVSGIPRNS
jgi:hypothetical protein